MAEPQANHFTRVTSPSYDFLRGISNNPQETNNQTLWYADKQFILGGQYEINVAFCVYMKAFRYLRKGSSAMMR